MNLLRLSASGSIVQEVDEVDFDVPASAVGTFQIGIDCPINQQVRAGSVGYAQFADPPTGPPTAIPIIIVGVNNSTKGHLLLTLYYLDNYAGDTVRLHYSLTEHDP